MSAFYSIEMLEMELLAMLLGKPTTVYAEHHGYVAPSIVVLTPQEIDELLDNDLQEHKQQLVLEQQAYIEDYASSYVGECAMCGEPLSKRIYNKDTEICNSCLSSLIGE